jgi:hypothetical protein
MLKKKHKYTNSFLADLLKLLRTLRVPNVPSSVYKIKQLINHPAKSQDDELKIHPALYFCTQCEQQSNLKDRCLNSQCSKISDLYSHTYSFVVMDIKNQIEHAIIQLNDQNIFQLKTNITFCY